MDAVAHTVQSFEQVAHGLPVQPVLDVLAAMPHLWEIDTRRQAYAGTNHADTRSILVRMPDEVFTPDDRTAAREWFTRLTAFDRDLPQELYDALDPILAQLVTLTSARKVARVMIVELKAGGEVTEHVDTGAYADHTDRFHVCLQNDFAMLAVRQPDGGIHANRIAEGEAWWFNHKRPHSAWNASDTTPRIHLIVDLVAPLYRQLRNAEPYSLQPELLCECWPEILPLCARHKDEIAHYQDIDLNVDVEKYEQLERMGVVKLYTVRSLPDWQLIGYEVVMVSPNLHYRDSVQAKVDVLYIAPEFRRGRLGMKLIDYVDSMLRDQGVAVTYQHVKHSHDFGPLLKRLNYESIETIWGRRLDRGKE